MTVLLVLLSLACIGAAVALCLRLTAGEFVLTPGNVYLVLLVLFHYPLLATLERSALEYAIVINLGLMGTVCGLYLGNWGVNPRSFRRAMLSAPMRISRDQSLGVLVAFAAIVSLLFYRGLPPSFSILGDALLGGSITGKLSEMSRVRADLTKSHYFGGGYAGQGALKIINEIAWQLVAVLAYLRAVTRGKWPAFFALAFLSCLVIYGVGAKGPVAYVIIGILVVRTFITNLPVKRVMRYALTLVAILLVIQSLQVSRLGRVEDRGFLTGVSTVLYERVVAGNGLNTYYIVDLMGQGTLEHQNGRDHFVKFMNALPGVQYEMPYAHKLFWLISEGKPSDKTTYSTYTYLGGSYLDFGYAGVALLSVLVGIILQGLYRLLFRLPRTTLNVAFAAVMSVHLGQIVAGSLISLPATLVAAGIVWVFASSPIAFRDRGVRYARS